MDEQEQIDQLRKSTEDLASKMETITTALLGDKLRDRDARSLIDDVSANREFRLNIEKKINKITGILATAIAGLTVKSFWTSLAKLLSTGGTPQ